MGDIEGILGYDSGNYEVIVTNSFVVESSGNPLPETTDLIPQTNTLTIASYNVLNLDPEDNDNDQDILNGKFQAIAHQIVKHLQTPDIVALQEVQDNSGAIDDGVTSADITYQTMNLSL